MLHPTMFATTATPHSTDDCGEGAACAAAHMHTDATAAR